MLYSFVLCFTLPISIVTQKGPNDRGDGDSCITLAYIHTVLMQLTQMQTHKPKLPNIENKNAGPECLLAEIAKSINKFTENAYFWLCFCHVAL